MHRTIIMSAEISQRTMGTRIKNLGQYILTHRSSIEAGAGVDLGSTHAINSDNLGGGYSLAKVER